MPATVIELSDVERRVLGHLPAWRSPKDQKEAVRLESEGHSDAEIKKLLAKVENPDDEREGTDEDPRIIGGCGDSIESYTVPELTERLRSDDHLPLALALRVIERGDTPRPLDEDLIQGELEALGARKLAVCDEGGNWTMTQAGLDALTA